jgi:hypothetical protein
MLAGEKLDEISHQWGIFSSFSEINIREEFSTQISLLQNLVACAGDNLSRSVVNRLERITNNAAIQDPAIISSGRGRPVGSPNSTRRDPSAFEYVEGTTGLNRCSKCGILGHNARTCTSETDLRLSQRAEGSNRRCGIFGNLKAMCGEQNFKETGKKE